ncbi:MAG: hypothetical protein K8H86_10415, partial [Ignavibacteriaceae bacterium]|nr:hypothetical protein [Ignavibacteriaceae bacterium]
MKKIIISITFIISIVNIAVAQTNLQYYLEKGITNSATLKEYQNGILLSNLQNKIDYEENLGVKISLTADYLFAPYLNNNGNIVSTNPDAKAIGYDVGITNGGLYSALINIEKPFYLGSLQSVITGKNETAQKQNKFNYQFEKHNLSKDITEQYI